MLSTKNVITKMSSAAASISQRGFSSKKMLPLSVQAIDTKEEADAALDRMRLAQAKFMDYSQEQVDHIFESVSRAATRHALELAKYAVEESGIGCVEDKVLKNLYASEYSLAKYKNLKTAGVVERDPIEGVYKVAEPMGPICAIVPCTNPACTVIIKALYALKTRNCMMFLPHPRTKLTSAYAANLVQKYALEAGAPADSIMCAMPSIEMSNHVMRHEQTKLILATGGPVMVQAAYSAGKPAIGVGSGNAPVLIDETYDLKEALSSVVIGKTFDNGTICASEQSVIVMEAVYEEAKRILTERGVHLLDNTEKAMLGKTFMPDGSHLNPEIVGKSPQVIANMAGLTIPEDSVALCVEASEVGATEVFSHEKLSPILALYKAKDFHEGVELARAIAHTGGLGHTSVLYTNPKNRDRIEHFHQRLPTYHISVNMPSSLGAIGIRYNFGVDPTFTVGVGSQGGSIASTNVGPRELIQIKTVAEKRDYLSTFEAPIIYSGRSCIRTALENLRGKGDMTVVVVSAGVGNTGGFLKELQSQGYSGATFTDFGKHPTWECLQKGVQVMKDYKPDAIFAVGDENTINVAKLVRLVYENPKMSRDQLTAPFMETRWRSKQLPVKKSVALIAVPTTFSGAEMTGHAHIEDEDKVLLPVCLGASLQPDAVIQDSMYLTGLPKRDIAVTGLQALIQGIESFTSAGASSASRVLAKEAVKTIFFNLQDAVTSQDARQKVLVAAGQVGMAASNSGLGTATALASKFRSRFNVPQGVALGVFIEDVIDFNSSNNPRRVAATPNYKYPMAKQHYAELARHMGLTPETDEEAVDLLKSGIRGLKKCLRLPMYGRDVVSEEDFLGSVDEMAESTFGDQLGSTNPRMPLLSELANLYRSALGKEE